MKIVMVITQWMTAFLALIYVDGYHTSSRVLLYHLMISFCSKNKFRGEAEEFIFLQVEFTRERGLE